MKCFKFIWTHESIGIFWNEYSNRMPVGYFSQKFGNDIIRLTKKHINGNVLDFGCGPGFLLEKMRNMRVNLFGVDYSNENVKITTQRLSNQRNFKGCEQIAQSFFDKNKSKFDTIFMVECIEHIIPEELPDYIKNISCLLKDHGKIIVTTPNKENFKRSECICPNCGACFHKLQHLSQWNSEKITKLMDDYGIKCLQCKETCFTGYGRLLSWIYGMEHKFFYGFFPNLLYIGQKI